MNTFSRLSTTATTTAPSSQAKAKGGGNKSNSSNSHDDHSNMNTKQPQSQKKLSQQRPIVPFGRKDRVLLIGEGMFIFFFFFLDLPGKGGKEEKRTAMGFPDISS